MRTVLEWLNKLFTDKSGDADEIPILTTVVVFSFVIYEGWSVIHNNHPFDPQSFGIGAGALIGAVTAALGARSKMEGQ